jgi:hypothetical protein
MNYIKKLKYVLTFGAIITCISPLMAQQKRISPHETISKVVDGNRVTIVYGRPYATQVSAHNYIELQLIRARLLGARTGVGHAIALFPNEPLVFGSLAQAGIGAREF